MPRGRQSTRRQYIAQETCTQATQGSHAMPVHGARRTDTPRHSGLEKRSRTQRRARPSTVSADTMALKSFSAHTLNGTARVQRVRVAVVWRPSPLCCRATAAACPLMRRQLVRGPRASPQGRARGQWQGAVLTCCCCVPGPPPSPGRGARRGGRPRLTPCGRMRDAARAGDDGAGTDAQARGPRRVLCS